MTKASINKIFGIMDNPKLSNAEKTKRILKIFDRQRKIDLPLLKGLLIELNQEPLLKIVQELESKKQVASANTSNITR